MQSTMELWKKALSVHHQAEWARVMNVTPSAFSQATKQGRLSPVLAGNIAMEIGENPEHWVAVAALEQAGTNTRDADLLARLKTRGKIWRRLLFSNVAKITASLSARASRRDRQHA